MNKSYEKMSELKVYADMAREWLAEDTDAVEDVRRKEERKAKIYDFLADCTMEDVYVVFDSGLLNCVVYGYVHKALTNLGYDTETKEAVNHEIKVLFGGIPGMSAEEAEDYYLAR